MRFCKERFEIVQRPINRVDAVIISDVITIVLQRRGVEGQQPDRGHSQVFEIIQFARQAGEVANAVSVGIHEGTDVQLVDDGVLVPKRIFDIGMGRT